MPEFRRFKSGDVKGTIRSDMRLRLVSNDVRRHRLISISYISLFPCHGTVKGNGKVREGTGGIRTKSVARFGSHELPEMERPNNPDSKPNATAIQLEAFLRTNDFALGGNRP